MPYEFFLVGGAKMSSSRGVGASARDMADLLPPEVLRFLMIRTKPNSPVNFDAQEEGIMKLFNEFDRYHARATATRRRRPTKRASIASRSSTPEGDYFTANFQLVTALVQMPHLDAVRGDREAQGRAAHRDRAAASRRSASLRAACGSSATPARRRRRGCRKRCPRARSELSATQRAFLHALAEALPETPWEDDALQSKIFEVARLTPIEQPLAFKAIYRVLLDREAGPKAGNLLAFLDPEFVIARFRELPLDVLAFWRESAIALEALEAHLTKDAAKIESWGFDLKMEGTVAANEITIVMKDGKRQLRRVLVEGTPMDERLAELRSRTV